ncbi:MAG TPA: hypothetical protein DDZ51_20470, partial [Planctomycetaceae bacterium]|nr:hypothetical protein [Planctomycetaceae bacterium]
MQIGATGPAGSAEIPEGTHFWVTGRIQTHGGTPTQWPTLTIHADLNSNGSIDPGELDISLLHSLWYFYASFELEDDGPSVNHDGTPGNGTPRDNFDITVRLVGVNSHDVELLHATAVNVPPAFVERPQLTFTTNTDGTSLASITNVNYFDPGIRDVITQSVIWGDEEETLVNSQEKLQRSYPSETETLPPDHYPITVLLTDDDTGVSKYIFEQALIQWNYDD